MALIAAAWREEPARADASKPVVNNKRGTKQLLKDGKPTKPRDLKQPRLTRKQLLAIAREHDPSIADGKG